MTSRNGAVVGLMVAGAAGPGDGRERNGCGPEDLPPDLCSAPERGLIWAHGRMQHGGIRG